MIDEGKYYVLNGGVEHSGNTNDWNTSANTISISEGGNSCGYVKFNNEKFWAGGHCYTLKIVKEFVTSKYLYHFLKLFEPKLMKLRVGSGLPNIQKKDIDKFIISIPLRAEQEKISDILDMSQNEIRLFKYLVVKYKEQKRGLMQTLLTGEWRVKT
jgi:type I restriction enzyme, S subunit